MSTLNVEAISHPTSGSNVTINGVTPAGTNQLGPRNLIINGAMQVAQRGTSSTTSGYGSVDRFRSVVSSGTVTQTQESLTSGDPYDEGFRYFYRATNTTAGSNDASEFRGLHQYIEAQNLASSGWNYASSTSYVTLSFWARSSVGGTYYGVLRSLDGTAQGYSFAYTLSADTWTKVTHTVPGNSNITFNNDNGVGLQVRLPIDLGTDYTNSSHTTETWAAWDNNNRCPDITHDWAGTTDATFDITGVQLEVGSVATPFEHRSYGDELARCQRYYYKTQPGQYASFAMGYNRNTTLTHAFTTFPVPMRTAPTSIETSGTAGDYSINYLASNATCSVVPSFDQGSAEGADFNFTVSSGLTAGQGAKAIAQTADGYLAWSAEL